MPTSKEKIPTVIIRIRTAPATAPELLGQLVHATRILGCNGKTLGFTMEGGQQTFTTEEVRLCEDSKASYF